MKSQVKSFFGHLSTPSERTVGMAWHVSAAVVAYDDIRHDGSSSSSSSHCTFHARTERRKGLQQQQQQ
jgi:hypothetical protein